MRRWICLLLCLLMLSGCRGIGGGSPNQRAVAQMLAVDTTEDGILLTVRILGEDGTPGSYQTAAASGRTISEAVSKIGESLGKELFLRDTRLILLGNGLCGEGIGVCRRYLTGGFEIRPRAVLAATEGTAAEHLTAKEGMAAPADEIVSVLQWSAGASGEGTTVLELDRRMHASGGDGYLPMLRLTPEGKTELAGGLLLKKEKSSRRLVQEELKGIRLLFLDPRRETLTIPWNGAQAVLKLSGCSRTLRAEIHQEQPVFTVKGTYDAELLEWTGAGTPPETEQLERAAESYLRELLETAIRTSVFEADTDLLGMDNALRRDAPVWWEQYQNVWRENRGSSSFYLDTECRITVQER